MFARRQGARRGGPGAALVVVLAAGTVLGTVGAGTGQAAGAPDLVVAATSPSRPGVQAVGADVVLTARVTNRGTAATPSGTALQVVFLVDGVPAASAGSTAPLAAGASRTLTATAGWTAALGSHPLVAQVDAAGLVAESDETDNQRQGVLVVAPVQPVTAVTARPALSQDAFARSQAPQTRTSWTVPAGQPVGTTYTLVEHPVEVSGNLCGPSDAQQKQTIARGPARTAMSTGTYCISHVYGTRVAYSVVATNGGTSVESALTGSCDWVRAHDTQSGWTSWRFGCDGSTVLTAESAP